MQTTPSFLMPGQLCLVVNITYYFITSRGVLEKQLVPEVMGTNGGLVMVEAVEAKSTNRRLGQELIFYRRSYNTARNLPFGLHIPGDIEDLLPWHGPGLESTSTAPIVATMILISKLSQLYIYHILVHTTIGTNWHISAGLKNSSHTHREHGTDQYYYSQAWTM